MSCFGKTLFLHISVAKIFVNKWTYVPQQLMFEYPHLSGKDPWWQTGVYHALSIVGISLICENIVSQLKISGFSGETFKGFEVLYLSMSATTTQLLSSG